MAIVFVVTRLKQFLPGRRFTLQTDHKPLIYLFAPDDEIPKTASARITRWAIALMGFYYELKYTPGEQMPHADALSRMDFDEDESDNDQVCFAINNIYFAQSDLVTQAEIKTELGTNRLFPDTMKRINNRKMHLLYIMESSSEVLFLSFHPNYDTWFWQKGKRQVPGRMQLRHQSE